MEAASAVALAIAAPELAMRASTPTAAPATGKPPPSAKKISVAPVASAIQATIFSQRTRGLVTADRSGSLGGWGGSALGRSCSGGETGVGSPGRRLEGGGGGGVPLIASGGSVR